MTALTTLMSVIVVMSVMSEMSHVALLAVMSMIALHTVVFVTGGSGSTLLQLPELKYRISKRTIQAVNHLLRL